MGHLEDADRCEQQRRGQRATEQLDRELATLDVPQDPWYELPAREGVAVGAHGHLGTGSAGDVGEAALGHHGAGPLLECFGLRGDARSLTREAADVDGGLPESTYVAQ